MGPATRDGYDAGERAVVPSLHALGVHALDAAVVSHGDNDHCRRLARGLPRKSRYWRCWLRRAVRLPGIVNCEAGQSWQWDGVRFRVLHPTRWFPYLGNESTCVIRIETAHGSVLLTGDMGEVIEQALLQSRATGFAQRCACWCDITAVQDPPARPSSRPQVPGWHWFPRAPVTALATRNPRWCAVGAMRARKWWIPRVRRNTGLAGRQWAAIAGTPRVLAAVVGRRATAEWSGWAMLST